MMTSKRQYIQKEYLKKFDIFIQDSLNKYHIVDPWKELYSNTGNNSYSIISNKSLIPDLVIFNKTFNKNNCFLYSNKNNKYIKYPRVAFIFKPKKLKYYTPLLNTNTAKNDDSNNQKMLEPFEFKSIPKEIEDKYIHNVNKKISNNNNILNELNDFFQNDNHKKNIEIKINILESDDNKESNKNCEQKTEKNNQMNDFKNIIQKRKYSNNDHYHKNKFEIPINMNNMINNYNNNNLNYINYIRNLNYQKMMQNIQFQNHVNKILGNINNLNNNNNQNNKINYSSTIEKKKENKNILNDARTVNNNLLDLNNEIPNNGNQKNKNDNDNDNVNPISYYKNTDEDDIIEKYINNIDLIFNKNKNKRDWKVVDNRNNFIVYNFNNEQLFYFLNTKINRKEDKFYSISDLESDILFNPINIYEDLKKLYQK